MTALVAFSCPSCGATVYTVPSGIVAHLCRSHKPRPKFVTFHQREAA